MRDQFPLHPCQWLIILNFKFKFLYSVRAIQIIYYILCELQLFIVSKELFILIQSFILIQNLHMYRCQLFAVFVIAFDVSSVQHAIPCFIPDIGYLYLLFLFLSLLILVTVCQIYFFLNQILFHWFSFLFDCFKSIHFCSLFPSFCLPQVHDFSFFFFSYFLKVGHWLLV